MISTWNSAIPETQGKLADRVAWIKIAQWNKESLNTVLTTHFSNFVRINNISTDIASLIDNKIIRCLMIAFDDLSLI